MINQDIIHLFHHLKSHLSTHDSFSFLQIVCSSYEQIRVVGYHPCDDEDILLVECGNSQIPDNQVDYLGDVEDEDLIFTAMIPFFSVIRQFSTDDDEKDIQGIFTYLSIDNRMLSLPSQNLWLNKPFGAKDEVMKFWGESGFEELWSKSVDKEIRFFLGLIG